MRERTGIELDEQLAQRLDAALWRAVEFGQAKAQQAVKRHGTIDVRNEIIANALNYTLEAVPQALDYFDIDQGRLVDMLEARLGMDLDGDGNIGGEPDDTPDLKLAS